MRFVVSGASGFVGRALVADLSAHGHEVVRLIRGGPADRTPLAQPWDPGAGVLDPRSLAGADVVVNLSGSNIGERRWSRAVKEDLRSSRFRSTELLVRTIARSEPPPRLLASASAVGFYGDRGEELLDERSSVGSGFLAELARDWEATALAAASDRTRVVLLRLGMVIGAGGALTRMLPLFRLGVGGPIGGGRQWWPWIGLDDVTAAVRFLVDRPEVSGPVNLTAPETLRCRELTAALARHLHRPAVLPAPAVAVRIALGEMADALLLASARVRPAVLLQAGFRFSAPSIADALAGAVP